MTITFSLLMCLPDLVFAARPPSEIFAAASNSIVVIELQTAKIIDENARFERRRLGSGVIVAKDKALTNCHVARYALEGTLLITQKIHDKEQFTYARPYARLKGEDLCLLKLSNEFGQPARLGSASKLRVGDAVYAIGAPQGLELTLSDGIVSQLRGSKNAPLIQTTAPISPGSSGGGLFDTEGQLVGITTFYLRNGQNLNFALPVEWLVDLYKPDNRIFNSIGVKCIELVENSLQRESLSNSEVTEIGECFDLIHQQQSRAFADIEESASPANVTDTTVGIPELFRVSETDRAVSYIKTSTVRRLPSGRVEAWELTDFKSPQYNDYKQKYYQSRLVLMEHDCVERQWKILSVTEYSGRMREGQAQFSASYPRNRTSEYVIPGTRGETVHDAVCWIAEQNRRD